ncbi:MAG: hypothetical protein KDA61_00425 [Planctomycetales bacterium]|nr:hypothetical protein [Planctomycetales bacterium]
MFATTASANHNGAMSPAPQLSSSCRDQRVGCPLPLVVGVFFLAFSVYLRGPVALGVALVFWGALELGRRRSQTAWLSVLVIYGAGALLAMASQIDVICRVASVPWKAWAMIDLLASLAVVDHGVRRRWSLSGDA